MGRAAVVSAAVAVAGGLAWSVRGRSSPVFGPSVWRGPRRGNRIALTFDDGPSASTPRILDLLERYGAKATFFQCGMHVRRLSSIAREVAAAGHEVGNHTDTHARLWLQSSGAIRAEIGRAQETIAENTGAAPRLFRPPYGVRWFGLRSAQAEHQLLGVMWTVLGRDWTLGATGVAERVLRRASAGAIICLHDGREASIRPDIENTIEALGLLLPRLTGAGYSLTTVSDLLE